MYAPSDVDPSDNISDEYRFLPLRDLGSKCASYAQSNIDKLQIPILHKWFGIQTGLCVYLVLLDKNRLDVSSIFNSCLLKKSKSAVLSKQTLQTTVVMLT